MNWDRYVSGARWVGTGPFWGTAHLSRWPLTVGQCCKTKLSQGCCYRVQAILGLWALCRPGEGRDITERRISPTSSKTKVIFITSYDWTSVCLHRNQRAVGSFRWAGGRLLCRLRPTVTFIIRRSAAFLYRVTLTRRHRDESGLRGENKSLELFYMQTFSLQCF